MVELRDFKGFVYVLSATQNGLNCLRMGFIFCGKHLLHITSIQVSDQGTIHSLVLSIDGHMKKPSASLKDLKGAACTKNQIRKKSCDADSGIIVQIW